MFQQAIDCLSLPPGRCFCLDQSLKVMTIKTYHYYSTYDLRQLFGTHPKAVERMQPSAALPARHLLVFTLPPLQECKAGSLLTTQVIEAGQRPPPLLLFLCRLQI